MGYNVHAAQTRSAGITGGDRGGGDDEPFALSWVGRGAQSDHLPGDACYFFGLPLPLANISGCSCIIFA